MYESHFGLSGPPFQLNPDPAFYYDSRGHSHALAYLKYGAHQGEGFIVVTGEIGAGKTTVVRTLLEGLDTTKVVAAQIVSSQLAAGDLLRAILIAFGVPVTTDSKAHLISTIEAYLTSLAAEGKRALLIIDEAQNLARESIEELRMLSNFQLGNHALLQSFLVGQPELRTLLKSKAMEQLRQRISASCHLAPLDCVDTRRYIEHRLTRVDWKGTPHFTIAAYERIHHWTGGVPRRINRLCNRLLLAAYLHNVTEISESLVVETASELRSEIGELSDMMPLEPASTSPAVDPAVLRARARPGPAPVITPAPLMEVDPTTLPVVVPPHAAVESSSGTLLCLCDSPTGFWQLAALSQVLGEFTDLPPLTIVHPGAERTTGAVSDRMLPVPFGVAHLRLEAGDYAQIASLAIPRFDAMIAEYAPSAVISSGTDDAVLACTMLAKKRGLPVLRLDAGKHRHAEDPDHLNAVLLDRLADELFTQTMADSHTLIREGTASDRVQCIGSLVPKFVALAYPFMRGADKALANFGVEASALQTGFALMSLRLPAMVDALQLVGQLMPALAAIAQEVPLIWPLRATERAAMISAGVETQLAQAGVILVQDRGYTGSLNLLRHARCLVMGPERELLEEAVALGKFSIGIGAAGAHAGDSIGEKYSIGAGFDADLASRAARAVIAGDGLDFDAPDFWDGSAADRMARRLRLRLGLEQPLAIRGLEVVG
jgi:putative secretion ATPase (PEP-CTERM system associated)